ncbi:MAG: DNA internalization-related competence protein ComEC/Rec2 [Gemmatimonadota bacterium]
MPLATTVFLALTSGLLLGFWGRPILTGLLVVALVALRWSRRADALVAGLVVALGFGAAKVAASDDRVCRRAALDRQKAVVRLATSIEPGRAATGYIIDGCRLQVRISARQRAPAGALIEVRGVFARSGEALSVRGASISILEGPSLLPRIRHRLGVVIDSLYKTDAAMARALVIADQRDVDREVRDRFADAGIIHMISVSGLHVSIITGSLLALLTAFGLTTRAAMIWSVVATAVYVATIGAPPPAVRSAAMSSLAVVSKLMQRPTSAWAVWAVGSGLSLVEPRIVLDLGWQLSVSGMAGLIASGNLVRRLSLPLAGWRAAVVESVIATTVASVASAPLCAWVFGRISVAAVVTNLVAAPLFGVVQPLLFASVALSPASAAAGFLADAARSGLKLIDLVASGGAAIPGAVLSFSPSGSSAVAIATAAGALIVACAVRNPGRWLHVAVGAVVVGLFWPLVDRSTGELEVYFTDVGQGDAIAVRSPGGRWLVVDAGPGWRTGDAAAMAVLPQLRRRGGDAVHLVMTHPHLDHIGGARSVLAAGIDTLWDAAYVEPGEEYLAVLRDAETRGIVWRRVKAGGTLNFDGVEVRFLAPDSAFMESLANPNDASVVLRLSYGNVSLMLTGDAEADAEEWLVHRYGSELRSMVLKVGHHGSSTSSSADFVRLVAPELAIVSVGRGNRYGHPSGEVLRRFEQSGAGVLRTDLDGTVVLRSDGRVLRVSADGVRWTMVPRQE